MSKKIKPDRLSNTILATLFFTKPGRPEGYGRGFTVCFAVAPRVGDKLDVEQNSIKRLQDETFDHLRWKVVEVRHEINLDEDVAEQNDQDVPVAGLWVTVHPDES